MEDSMIVDLYLQRDETAIEHTAEKYGSRIRSLAYRMLGDIRSAEECENDTYLEAWNSIPPHEPRSYLYAFLARITRHLALNICRDGSRLKRRAHICELDAELDQCIPAPSDIEDEVDTAALSKSINEFLAGLEEEKRNIFVRRYWYFDTVEDISKRFSISESKVKTTLFRCREQLKTYLEKEGFFNMNGSQMLDIMGLIDPAFIEAAETAGTCAKPAHVSVFRKRPWVKWAAVAAAVLIVAAGAPGAIYMMGHFGSGGYADPRGGSETPGIIPSDGSEGSGQSGESETPGSSGTAGDNEQENTPKPGGETTSDLPGNSSQNSGGSDSDIPGGEQHETPEEPREIVISGWKTPSGESGTFVKENMPNITLKISGNKRSFNYQSSSYVRSTDGIALDGKDVYYTIDRYINDGTVIEKYGGSTRILQCECPPVGGFDAGDGPMDMILSNADAERKARLIAWYTDIDLDGLENAVASVQKDGNIYCVTLTVPDGSVELCINTRGSLISIKVTEGTPRQPSEDRIAAAKEKMYAKLDELNKETSGGKYILDKAHFEAWGENTYIVFAVNYYHDAHSDAHSVRDYYFLV